MILGTTGCLGLVLLGGFLLGGIWLLGHLLTAVGLGFERPCPACLSMVNKRATRCKHCHVELDKTMAFIGVKR